MLQGMGFWYFIIHGFSYIFFFKAIFSTTKFHAWHEEVFIDFNPFAHLSRPPWTFLAAKHRRVMRIRTLLPRHIRCTKKRCPPEKKGKNIQLEKKWWPLNILKKHLVQVYIFIYIFFIFKMVPIYKEDLDFGLNIFVYITRSLNMVTSWIQQLMVCMYSRWPFSFRVKGPFSGEPLVSFLVGWSGSLFRKVGVVSNPLFSSKKNNRWNRKRKNWIETLPTFRWWKGMASWEYPKCQNLRARCGHI